MSAVVGIAVVLVVLVVVVVVVVVVQARRREWILQIVRQQTNEHTSKIKNVAVFLLKLWKLRATSSHGS